MEVDDQRETKDNSDIDDVDPILSIKPPTAKEHKAFASRTAGNIVITTKKFRYDFTRSDNDSFNKQAIHVAVKGFKEAFEGGKYTGMMGLDEDDELPEEFLWHNHVVYTATTYFKTLTARYKVASSPDVDAIRDRRLMVSAMNSRRLHVSLDPLLYSSN